MDKNKNNPSDLDAAVRSFAGLLLQHDQQGLKQEDIKGMAFTMDVDLTINTFNPEAVRTLKYKAHELEGRPILDLLTDQSESELLALKPALAELQEECNPIPMDFKPKRSDAVIPCLCTIRALDGEGGPLQFTAIKISHQDKAIQKKLRNMADRLSEHLNVPTDGDGHKAVLTEEERIRLEAENIERNAVNPLHMPVSDMADRAHMSESTFRRQFKKIMEKSIDRFIHESLVKRAERLLLDPARQVKDVAIELRYTVQGFNDMFRNATGETPGAYQRKMQRKGR